MTKKNPDLQLIQNNRTPETVDRDPINVDSMSTWINQLMLALRLITQSPKFNFLKRCFSSGLNNTRVELANVVKVKSTNSIGLLKQICDIYKSEPVSSDYSIFKYIQIGNLFIPINVLIEKNCKDFTITVQFNNQMSEPIKFQLLNAEIESMEQLALELEREIIKVLQSFNNLVYLDRHRN